MKVYRKDHNNCLYSTKLSALKTYVQVTLKRLRRYIYVFRNIYVTTINKRRNHENAERGIEESLEERQGGTNDVI